MAPEVPVKIVAISELGPGGDVLKNGKQTPFMHPNDLLPLLELGDLIEFNREMYAVRIILNQSILIYLSIGLCILEKRKASKWSCILPKDTVIQNLR